MKTILLTEDQYEKLARIHELLNTQDECLTDQPAYVVYRGIDIDDPTKKVEVVCITAEDAQRALERESHRGPHFIYVHSFRRGNLGRWLLDFLKEGLSLPQEPAPVSCSLGNASLGIH